MTTEQTDNLAGIRHAVWNFHGSVLDIQIHLPLPLGFTIPLLQLLFILLTLFVPVLGYIYARRFRNKYRDGNFSFLRRLFSLS